MEDYTEDMFVDEFTLSDTDKLPLEDIIQQEQKMILMPHIISQ